MKRLLLSFTALFCMMSAWSVDFLTLNNVQYSVDTLAHFMAGPGTYYTQLELKASNRLHVYFLTIDKSNPNIRIESALGRDSILMGERPSSMAARKSKDGSIYFGGVNGDFYVTQGDVGLPTGGTLIEKQLAHTPNNSRKVVGFDGLNNMYLGLMSYSGKAVLANGSEITINRVNYTRGNNQVVLFNEHNGSRTRTNEYGCEVELALVSGDSWEVNSRVRAVVVSTRDNAGNSVIAKGGAILSGHGTGQTALQALAVGDTISLDLNTTVNGQNSDFTSVIGGDPRALMLNNGVLETGDIWNELHPRTGMGASVTGDTLVFCVVDGRGVSAGCTTYVLAQLMQSAGAHSAINLDGGGSSALYIREFGPMNRVSDGTERAVSNAIFAVANAPISNTIAKIRSVWGHYQLPPYGIVRPTIMGYTAEDILIDLDVNPFTLSCDTAYGYINAFGEFVASKGVNGFFTATYGNGISVDIPYVLTNDFTFSILQDSVILDNDAQYRIEVVCQVGTKTLAVEPNELNWRVLDNTICEVNQGVVTALRSGETLVIGTHNGVSDTLRVLVEMPEESLLVWERFDESTIGRWTMTTAADNWNAVFSPYVNGTPASIDFTYKATRSPFITLTSNLRVYSTPDSIQVRFNPNNVALKEVNVGVRANNSSKIELLKYTDVEGSGLMSLTIDPLTLTEGVVDAGVFPLYLTELTYYLKAADMQENSVHKLEMHDIRLFFANVEVEYTAESLEYGLSVYPNPVRDGEVHVEWSGMKPVSCQLVTLEGKVVKSIADVTDNGNRISVNVSGLSAGYYVLVVNTGEKQLSYKLIIK